MTNFELPHLFHCVDESWWNKPFKTLWYYDSGASSAIVMLRRLWWYATPLGRHSIWIQYIPRNMHTVFALLCFVVVIHWLIFPYQSGLLHWHCGNLTIAPLPAKQPWWIWINTSCEFIMKDCITTTKQSTTKPCAYFLGYTVCSVTSQNAGIHFEIVNRPQAIRTMIRIHSKPMYYIRGSVCDTNWDCPSTREATMKNVGEYSI